jgi:hypothetical protein
MPRRWWEVNALYHWTGFVVWCVVAMIAWWLLYEIVRAFVTTCSFLRFMFALRARYPSEVESLFTWRTIPRFLRQWWIFLGHRNDGCSRVEHRGKRGEWRGIGDWSIYSQEHKS